MFKKSIRSRIMEKLNPIIDKAEADYEGYIKNADEVYFKTVESAVETRQKSKDHAVELVINSLNF